MARVLLGNLVVGMQWEALLGLSKESDEVRELAARRGARQYLVLRNLLGSQVVGLASLPGRRRKSEFFALAGLLRESSDDQNILFLHSDPDDADKVILIGIHDGKPVEDRLVAREDATEAARQFIQEVGTGVTILGDIADGQLETTRQLRLEEVAGSLTREAMAAYRLRPLPPSRMVVAALLAVALACVGGGVKWWMHGREQELQTKLAAIATARPDQGAEYRAQAQAALQSPSLSRGTGYARTMQAAILQLPRETGGWKMARLSCKAAACDALWQRGEGGSFATLLAQRPRVQFQGMNAALESVAFTAVADKVTPVPITQFYLKTGVRMQALEDYGKSGKAGDKALQVTLDKAEPLVPLPAGLTEKEKAAPQVAKGAWTMQGHLAFLDSVAGLMERSGNMAIDEIAVTLSDESPQFSAKGTFYVQ
ncbi:type 4b pilus protein PilO2 [Chromobacterium vaccinii]|uniref:Type 4b pilus protein PilO2 n=1 Tax=Chromobacterium vaccinii TaxID=1108595 RepID=A0ABV0F631_9NEIS